MPRAKSDLIAYYGLPARAVKLQSFASLQTLVNRMQRDYDGGAIFRGQANSVWEIDTRLSRTFDSQWSAAERRMLQIFEGDAVEHLPPFSRVETRLDWLSYIQHHGGPTRLLDWTQSPYIALFFACCDQPDLDGAMWTLDVNVSNTLSRKLLRQHGMHHLHPATSTSEIVDFAIDHAVPVLMPLAPRHRFRRMTAQSGIFTLVGGKRAATQDATTAFGTECKDEFRHNKPLLKQYIIPSDLKASVLDLLNSMNITEATIYPGLDGLARSLYRRDYIAPFFA